MRIKFSSLFLSLLLWAAMAYHSPAQSKESKKRELEYKVWKVFSPDTKGFTAVIISIDPNHFNRADMMSLASEIRKEFIEKDKLKVGILDDANTARLFVTGGLELPDYDKAERGRYTLDRAKCQEQIEFSTRRGKPVSEVRISFKCSR
jgi:hypothetical protein